jgi:osmotically-inducible protein OsmY
MKKLLFGFIVGVITGAGGYWYFTGGTGKSDLANARDMVAQQASKVKQVIGDIRVEDIKQELAKTGTVVRERAQKTGEAIADATADARITAAVKAKFMKEPGLNSMKIHVETSDGLVTLSGLVGSHEEVAKAVKLALETEGVHKVVSTLQVKPGA